MTGRLESLVYTDCLPGQSLTGQAGFGFQAATPGAGGDARALTRDHLLYEPPAEWMRRGRPVADYPASLAYVHADGWYATAAGVYLGKEAKGERQGNHLTHAVLSRDPAVYDLIRPAQLAGAGFWRTVPGGGTPEVGPNWEPGALDADTVAGRVRPGPLGAMLAALTGGEERLVLVGEDAGEILAWIAAVTLLLPQRVALDTGFKVFTTRPSHGAHRLVGVHPDWFGEPPPGVHVFDLRDGTHTTVEDDEVAALWARLFCEEDALDVVDAVELAAQCSSDGLDAPAAQALACAAFFGHVPPMRHAPALTGWLRDSDDDRYLAYGGRVTDALMRLPDRPHEVLSALHELAVSGRLAEDAAAIRLALLEEECRDTVVHTGSLPPLPLGAWHHDDEARERLTSRLRDADPPRFHRLLRVGIRFGVPCDPLRDAPAAAMAFLDWWSHRPGLRPDPGELDPGLRDALIDLLGDRCEDDDEASRVGAAWAAWLFRQRPATGDHPFFLACLGAAMRIAPADLRARRAARHLTAAPAGTLPTIAAALWRWRSPQREDIAAMLPALPSGTVLDPGLFAAFRARLLAHDSTLDDRDLEIARELLDKGLLRDDELRALVADAAALAALRVPPGRDGLVGVASQLGHLHEFAPQLLRLHGHAVLAVLLGHSLPTVATLVVPDLAASDRDAYASALTHRLREPSGTVLYCAYMVVRGGHASAETEARLRAALRKAIRAASDDVIGRAGEVAASVRPGWRDVWFAYVERVRRGGIARLWRSRKGG